MARYRLSLLGQKTAGFEREQGGIPVTFGWHKDVWCLVLIKSAENVSTDTSRQRVSYCLVAFLAIDDVVVRCRDFLALSLGLLAITLYPPLVVKPRCYQPLVCHQPEVIAIQKVAPFFQCFSDGTCFLFYCKMALLDWSRRVTEKSYLSTVLIKSSCSRDIGRIGFENWGYAGFNGYHSRIF